MKGNPTCKMPSWLIRTQWMLLKWDRSKFLFFFVYWPIFGIPSNFDSSFIKARCKLADTNAACGRYANASQLYKDLLDIIPDEVVWHYKLYEVAFSLWLCFLMLQVSLGDE